MNCQYLLFEKSAVEWMANSQALQSTEFHLSESLIGYIRKGTGEFQTRGIASARTRDGIIFCGKATEKTFLLFDLKQCALIEETNETDLLMVLQKVFRFCIRFWNHQSFTSTERMFSDKTVIFPFPYSSRSSYRIVIQRSLPDRRLDKREIKNCLLVYKYGKEGVASNVDEIPDFGIYKKAGEDFLDHLGELRNRFLYQKRMDDETNKDQREAIHMFSMKETRPNSEFKYMNYERQIENLTTSQKEIVECKDKKAPIRIDGPAGTGKTAAMVLRAIRMLMEAEEKDEELHITYFTHSKSTEMAVRQMFSGLVKQEWLDLDNFQYLEITTLQEYCIKFVDLKETKVLDLDASEAKQFQLLQILEVYNKLKGATFKTFRPLMTEEMVCFFENEQESTIIRLLQQELSVRIKGMSEGKLENYKKLTSKGSAVPAGNESDREFIFYIYSEYQKTLEQQDVYDTDDIVLEALARLDAPLWRRSRVTLGIDYLIVDEMHLFNLNEQQVFHYLTKDEKQSNIPICFALDYAQVIGQRGELSENYIETELSKGQVMDRKLSMVFRNSPWIAELCASITASGALLFDAFINPYENCKNAFDTSDEMKCKKPQLFMYDNDVKMESDLENQIICLTREVKCRPGDIALVFFDEHMFAERYQQTVGKYEVTLIDGRVYSDDNIDLNRVVCTLPEFINGLEFQCVILVAVDDGRVPQSGINDLSANYLKYSALNKLYLSCSRAKTRVIVMGTKVRGISSCLRHSLDSGALILHENY